MLSIYYVFYNKYSISRYNMMTNYKAKKAGGNPRIRDVKPFYKLDI